MYNNRHTGVNYNSDLTLKDIAKLMRTYLKSHYPDCKFSVTTSSGFLFQKITIALLKSPYDEQSCETVKIIKEVDMEVNSYICDNTDVQNDYFDVNFYYFGCTNEKSA